MRSSYVISLKFEKKQKPVTKWVKNKNIKNVKNTLVKWLAI